MARRLTLIDRAVAHLEGEIAVRQHAIDVLRAATRNGTADGSRRRRSSSAKPAPPEQVAAGADQKKGTTP